MKEITGKPHKFFYSEVNFDKQELDDYVQTWYKYMSNKYTESEQAFNYVDDTMTKLVMLENTLGSYSPISHELLLTIRKVLLDACKYYEIDYKKEKYYLHSWLNYIQGPRPVMTDSIKLDNHGTNPLHFHGYFAIDAEPSITYYDLDEKDKNDPSGLFPYENKNGRVMLSLNGYHHGVGSWNETRPRITLAYNIIPQSHIPNNIQSLAQYLPLLCD
jgi:hypothetical protein